MAIEDLLTKGLAAGFGGGTAMQGVKRGGFELESSHLEDGEGVYHDEWAADRVGGGQELVEKDGKRFTRVYAGGTLALEELQQMGITKGDIMGHLKHQLVKNGEKIRLYGDFTAEDGDWSYAYKVLDREEAIPTTVGKEVISYKGQMVFVHHFIFCPVE
jgi:hypothetical protein